MSSRWLKRERTRASTDIGKEDVLERSTLVPISNRSAGWISRGWSSWHLDRYSEVFGWPMRLPIQSRLALVEHVRDRD